MIVRNNRAMISASLPKGLTLADVRPQKKRTFDGAWDEHQPEDPLMVEMARIAAQDLRFRHRADRHVHRARTTPPTLVRKADGTLAGVLAGKVHVAVAPTAVVREPHDTRTIRPRNNVTVRRVSQAYVALMIDNARKEGWTR